MCNACGHIFSCCCNIFMDTGYPCMHIHAVMGYVAANTQPFSPDQQPCSPNAQPCSPDIQTCSSNAQPCSPDPLNHSTDDINTYFLTGSNEPAHKRENLSIKIAFLEQKIEELKEKLQGMSNADAQAIEGSIDNLIKNISNAEFEITYEDSNSKKRYFSTQKDFMQIKNRKRVKENIFFNELKNAKNKNLSEASVEVIPESK